MKPYLNLALLSKDWLDHGRDSRSQSRARRRLYQPFISSKVGNALMQMTFSWPPLRRIFKKNFFSKMLLQSVTERSLSVSFRSMLQCVCVRSKRRINNVCSSFFVLCSKICTAGSRALQANFPTSSRKTSRSTCIFRSCLFVSLHS